MQEIDQFQLELGSGSEIGMMLVLAVMMFSVALSLRVQHFAFFRTHPSLYFSGVAAQLIGLPLVTLTLCYLLQPLPSVALGMILISCCPGGNVSNLLVLLARGNTALSVSLTATSSLAAAVITPLAIVFWCSLYPPTAQLLTEIDFDKGSFLIQTTLILAVPLILGMLLARWFNSFAQRIQKPLVVLSSLGLLLIIIGASIKYIDQFIILGVGLFGLVLIHNACAYLTGFTAARLVRADGPSTRALTFEVGIQNSGLGIVILLTQLGGLGGAAAVAGLWGTWHIVAGLTLVYFFRRWSNAESAAIA